MGGDDDEEDILEVGTSKLIRWFEFVMLGVNALNILWIGLEVDLNSAPILSEAPWYVQVLENAFCVLFLLEWIVNVYEAKPRADLLKSKWFLFNTFLLVQMIVETWLMYLMTATVDAALLQSAGLLRIFRAF